MQRKLLGAVCLFVLCGILVAGLWPFRAPRNQISWLSNGNGLRFGEYGSIVSSSAFRANEAKIATPCSLEMWLQPSRDYSGTILAFYRPDNSIVPFKLWQSHGYLGIQRTTLDQFQRPETTTLYAGEFFRRAQPVFVTISSGAAGTAVYADGVLIRNSPDFRFSSQNLSGRFLVGNGPIKAYPWSGEIRGLAIYGRELTPGEVSEHYAYWTRNARPDPAQSAAIVALYLFNEGQGSVVHNRVDSTTDLLIPGHFFVLHEQFLEPPWKEFAPSWSYWKNVGINVAGFVPLGFFFSWYFISVAKSKRALLATVILGFMVSLTIEVLQAFLPTRDSGMTDLITNTFGTALGSMMWSSLFARTRLEQPLDRVRGHVQLAGVEIGRP
jgi:hypothetical protein